MDRCSCCNKKLQGTIQAWRGRLFCSCACTNLFAAPLQQDISSEIEEIQASDIGIEEDAE